VGACNNPGRPTTECRTGSAPGVYGIMACLACRALWLPAGRLWPEPEPGRPGLNPSLSPVAPPTPAAVGLLSLAALPAARRVVDGRVLAAGAGPPRCTAPADRVEPAPALWTPLAPPLATAAPLPCPNRVVCFAKSCGGAAAAAARLAAPRRLALSALASVVVPHGRPVLRCGESSVSDRPRAAGDPVAEGPCSSCCGPALEGGPEAPRVPGVV